jgi:hypothetical protein
VSPYHGVVGKRGAPRRKSLEQSHMDAGWEKVESETGAISFEKPASLNPAPVAEPERRENVILAVVRGLGGKIRSIIPIRQTLG